MRKAFLITLASCLCCMSIVAGASDTLPTFSQLASVPATPNASGPFGGYAYGIAADALGDGRFILYDGNEILIQDAVDSDSFTSVASGYIGDPGFIAVAPDGHTCLVSAGYGGQLWLFDANAPVNAGTAFDTVSNFHGVWLSDTLVLIDLAVWVGPGAFDYAAEQGILDVTSPGSYKTVVNKGGVGTQSAAVACDESRQYAYACEGASSNYRRFAVADLISVFQSAGASALAWSTGTSIGTFSALPGGAYAVSDAGTLICGGYLDAFGVIDPVAGTVADTDDPAAAYVSYNLAYNGKTGKILAIANEYVGFPSPNNMSGFVSDDWYESVPAAGGIALGALVGLLALGAVRATRRIR
ncbi:MAG: hypothetical protein GY851_36255 [bacterium]|nr:hypothetical protein [bacterium]